MQVDELAGGLLELLEDEESEEEDDEDDSVIPYSTLPFFLDVWGDADFRMSEYRDGVFNDYHLQETVISRSTVQQWLQEQQSRENNQEEEDDKDDDDDELAHSAMLSALYHGSIEEALQALRTALQESLLSMPHSGPQPARKPEH